MTAGRSALDELPGELMMWVLIVSELLVFGGGLAAFLAVRITDPAGFAAGQDLLHRAAGGINTMVLVTSGWCAARATRAAAVDRRGTCRGWLAAAAALGIVFLAVKASEFADLARQGVGTETGPFFTFYFLLTGFHAAHVAAGVLLLGVVGWGAGHRGVEAGAAFWHMVDLVWVLLFPVVYLLR